MDPTGNSKAIQDATYGLLGPQRDIARASEVQRLKNQGLTEDSPAFQRAMQRLDQGDTDAQLKSLLAGQTEYGNSFNRGLAESNQNFGQNLQSQTFAQQLRDKQLQEQITQRTQPLSELSSLSGMSNPNSPAFGTFIGAGNAGGTDQTTAAQQQYNASLSNYNAEQASKAQTTNALMGLLGNLGTSASVSGTPMNSLYNLLSTSLKGLIGGSGSSSGTPSPDPDTSGYPVEGDPYNPGP
jgi:hypothetical protein